MCLSFIIISGLEFHLLKFDAFLYKRLIKKKIIFYLKKKILKNDDEMKNVFLKNETPKMCGPKLYFI